MDQIKVNFPRFAGDDLSGWLYKSENFFERNGTPWDRKVMMAVVHLEGQALQRHQVYMLKRMTRETPRWEEYVQALHTQFEVTTLCNSKAGWVTWRQTDEQKECLETIDSLAAWKRSSCSQQNTNLRQSQEITYTYGGTNDTVAGAHQRFPAPSKETCKPSTLVGILSTPKQQLMTLKGEGRVINASSRRLTSEKMDDTREITTKEDEIPDDTTEEHELRTDLQLSLGNLTICREVCRSLSWVLLGNECCVDIFRLRLEGCDMVLVVKGLATLRDIVWIFQELTMRFTYEGRAYLPRGSTEFKREGIGVHATAVWWANWLSLKKLDMTIYERSKLLEFDKNMHLVVFWISCDAGTYVPSFYGHIGLLLDVGGHMQELRRIGPRTCERLLNFDGEIGAATKLKWVTELLEGIHLVAVVEAISLGIKHGSAAGFGRGYDAGVVKVYEGLNGVSVVGKLLVLEKDVVMSSLSSEWPHEPNEDIHMLNQNTSKTLVVLDDDPTGTQTVHNFEEICSNRHMTTKSLENIDFTLVLRLDSTLCGHFPEGADVAVSMLIGYKRLIMKVSAVNVVCYGDKHPHSRENGSDIQRHVDFKGRQCEGERVDRWLLWSASDGLRMLQSMFFYQRKFQIPSGRTCVKSSRQEFP